MMAFKMLEGAAGVALCALVAVGCGGSSSNDNTGGSAGQSSGGNAGTGAKGGSGGTTGGSGGSTGGAGGGLSCAPDAQSCTQPSDCTLTAASCCICGEGQLSDYLAVTTANAGTCACQGPACGCATMENPNLTAVCTSGKCTGLDVRQSDYSACTQDTDCRLRVGLGCCEGCASNGFDLVAVNVNETNLTQALCGSGTAACPGCAPEYPPDKKAVCVSNHCQVQ